MKFNANETLQSKEWKYTAQKEYLINILMQKSFIGFKDEGIIKFSTAGVTVFKWWLLKLRSEYFGVEI